MRTNRVGIALRAATRWKRPWVSRQCGQKAFRYSTIVNSARGAGAVAGAGAFACTEVGADGRGAGATGGARGRVGSDALSTRGDGVAFAGIDPVPEPVHGSVCGGAVFHASSRGGTAAGAGGAGGGVEAVGAAGTGWAAGTGAGVGTA